MKRSYPRVIPIWLLFLLMASILLLMSSCRGGRSISGNSTGITIISPSNLERQADGTYRIKPAPPKKTQPKEIKTPPQKPVMPAPVKIKLTPVPPVSSAKLESFTPSSPKNELLPLPAHSGALIPLPPEVVNVLPTLPEEEAEPEIAGPREVAPVKINWVKLILFYLSCIILGVFGWIGYNKFKNSKIKSKKRVTRPKKKKS